MVCVCGVRILRCSLPSKLGAPVARDTTRLWGPTSLLDSRVRRPRHSVRSRVRGDTPRSGSTHVTPWGPWPTCPRLMSTHVVETRGTSFRGLGLTPDRPHTGVLHWGSGPCRRCRSSLFRSELYYRLLPSEPL